jgi:hypothetical protein
MVEIRMCYLDGVLVEGRYALVGLVC